MRLANLGAHVHAFDLSRDSLSIAKGLAQREKLDIACEEMPAESMRYGDDFFDFILARDILHHVDIPLTMAEIRRVSKPGAMFIVNEIYSHSLTDRVRRSAIIEKFVYANMQRFIYSGDPYITEDERKLTELDIAEISKSFRTVEFKRYFNFLVTRIVPDQYDLLSQLDRLSMLALKPVARYIAGRVLFSGQVAR